MPKKQENLHSVPGPNPLGSDHLDANMAHLRACVEFRTEYLDYIKLIKVYKIRVNATMTHLHRCV